MYIVYVCTNFQEYNSIRSWPNLFKPVYAVKISEYQKMCNMHCT